MGFVEAMAYVLAGFLATVGCCDVIANKNHPCYWRRFLGQRFYCYTDELSEDFITTWSWSSAYRLGRRVAVLRHTPLVIVWGPHGRRVCRVFHPDVVRSSALRTLDRLPEAWQPVIETYFCDHAEYAKQRLAGCQRSPGCASNLRGLE